MNVKLNIVAVGVGVVGKIPPRKHSVTPPVPGVSDLSQLFREALKTFQGSPKNKNKNLWTFATKTRNGGSEKLELIKV